MASYLAVVEVLGVTIAPGKQVAIQPSRFQLMDHGEWVAGRIGAVVTVQESRSYTAGKQQKGVDVDKEALLVGPSSGRAGHLIAKAGVDYCQRRSASLLSAYTYNLNHFLCTIRQRYLPTPSKRYGAVKVP